MEERIMYVIQRADGKLDVSAITVMKRSGYSYCDRIALEIEIPYQTVLPIVWGLWDSEFKKK